MELLNATGMEAGYTMGMEPSGRELLVVVVKGTFRIPRSGDTPELADEQRPLVMADTFTGEPGFSAPVYEADFPPYKPRCDVLLNGSAYAPQGRPARKVQVSMSVGPLTKTFNVVGPRHWETVLAGIGASPAEAFEVMPISYDGAFGGLDNFHADESKHTAYMANPIGRGYHKQLEKSLVDGTPMPSTEEVNWPVRKPGGNYSPMAFGPVGRGWEERLKYAGTYDDDWLANVFPFLPADFQPAYYQAAPANQQLPYLIGGEEVFLENLTPEGTAYFKLPILDVPVVFFRKRGGRLDTTGVIDSLVIEPDLGVFSMSWRAHLPLKRNIFEIPQVLVGRKSKAWWRAWELGMEYYPSLEHLIRQRKTEAMEEEEAEV
jgi:hypothetical protein